MAYSLEECGGDVEHWFHSNLDRFEGVVGELTESGDLKTLKAELNEFEQILQEAARQSIEHSRGWRAAAEAAKWTGASPAKRLAYLARRYELRLKEHQESSFPGLECRLHPHFQLAECLHEMAQLHEADGDLKMAADLYQRALQHMEDALNICDADFNREDRSVPRRPQWRASLERVKKLMGQ